MHGEQWNDEHKMKEAFLPLEEDLSKSEDSGQFLHTTTPLRIKEKMYQISFKGR